MMPHQHTHINLKEFHKKVKDLRKELECDDLKRLDERLAAADARRANPYFGMTARLTRLLWPQFMIAYQHITDAFNEYRQIKGIDLEMPATMPLIINSKNASELIVFPNIILTFKGIDGKWNCQVPVDKDSLMKMGTMSAYQHYHIIENILKKEEDPKLEKLFSVPSRVWKHIRSNSTISTGKLFRSYIFEDKKYSDDFIKHMVSVVEEFKKPTTIYFADTPEEFTKMYSSGPSSCMSLTGRNGDSGSWWDMFKKTGTAPVHFYSYCTFSRGAYTMRGDTVRARTIIYEIRPGRWCYGRMYGDAKDTKILANALQMQNIGTFPYGTDPDQEHIIGNQVYRPDVEFRIKPTDYEGRIVYPVTYFDNAYNSFIMDIDEKTQELIARQDNKKGKPINAGYISREQVKVPKCAVCKGNAVSDIRTTVNEVFCSDACAKKRNAVAARRSDGSTAWCNRDNALLIEGIWFEHELSAIRAGAHWLLKQEPDGTQSEDVVLSRNNIYGVASGLSTKDEPYAYANSVIYADIGKKRKALAAGNAFEIIDKQVSVAIFNPDKGLMEKPIRVTDEMLIGLDDDDEMVDIPAQVQLSKMALVSVKKAKSEKAAGGFFIVEE